MQNLRWLGNDLKVLYTTASLPIAVRNNRAINLLLSSDKKKSATFTHDFPTEILDSPVEAGPGTHF